ncbi:MAG: SDR family oxidoreductase [Sandaracinus sp.]|nr:SDR family oxidoreductase [Sandaracinus sp.]MCB9612740.1 SDR family oxidoreductase [Sandaracinus sp.]MCB9631761.1 SDR family oxidoreductase [Sandaracinus sp.]
MDSEFRGKVLAITGAGSGIGRALATLGAQSGAELALADVNVAGLEETVAQVTALGAKVSSRTVDVASRDAVFAWRDAVLAEHGRVDAILNNAGVSLTDTIAEMSWEDLDWIVGINFWGVVYGTKAFLPHLLERRTGWVVNVSSIFGMVAFPTQGAYNATKFAVRGFTEALVAETKGTGVTVCCVHPGGIKTNIVRASRFRRGRKPGEDREKIVKTFDQMARTTPEACARTIFDGMARQEARILVGNDAKLLDLAQRLSPRRYRSALARLEKLTGR